MANLEEMREFQKHWDAYRDDAHALELLCTRLPVDLDGLTPKDASKPLSEMPASVTFDHEVLRDAYTPLAAQTFDLERDARAWGWWEEEPAWKVVAELKSLMLAVEGARGVHTSLEAAEQAAIDADESYAHTLEAIQTYVAANKDDQATLDELKAVKDDPEQLFQKALEHEGKQQPKRAPRALAAVLAVGGAAALAFIPVEPALRALAVAAWLIADAVFYVRPWQSPRGWLFKNHRMKEELSIIDGKIADATTRKELREREVERLQGDAAAKLEKLKEPYVGPLEEARVAVEDAERAVIDRFEQDLVARDETYEAGSLAKLSFDDAVAEGNRREWALLAAWMDRYVVQLHDAIRRAEDVQASESVWLDGHAPFGRRWWDKTDDVVKLMEAGRAASSEAALKMLRDAEQD